ncbi:hypothetical protein [Flavobacterium sp. WV_118_3]|uniref:hypothetical protein n=1 Tax=Flavobacterium sp. WV_118_3 TaxID=3151764 RepID=UPI00321B37CA
MKTLLNKILFFLFFISLYSCSKNEKNENEYSKIINSKELFSTQDSKGKLLSGSNFYFDKKGDLITSFIYYENNDSIFHYEMKVINSKGQIVYFGEYKNGEILREFDSYIFEKVDKVNGAFLYENYCKKCHFQDKRGIGKSMWELKRINKEMLYKKIENHSVYDTLSYLTDKQILSLVEYLGK